MCNQEISPLLSHFSTRIGYLSLSWLFSRISLISLAVNLVDIKSNAWPLQFPIIAILPFLRVIIVSLRLLTHQTYPENCFLDQSFSLILVSDLFKWIYKWCISRIVVSILLHITFWFVNDLLIHRIPASILIFCSISILCSSVEYMVMQLQLVRLSIVPSNLAYVINNSFNI